MEKLRIQKYLAEIGVASRRAVEEMVLEHRISVNGKTITELPCFVQPEQDTIRVDGRLIKKPRNIEGGRVYYLLNKPRGVVCSQSDPSGKPLAVDLIPKISQRVYCVGRLDVDSTGLIILTNDGSLTQYLTHPKYGVSKTYVVSIDGSITAEDIEKLKKGMYLDGKKTQGVGVRVMKRGAHGSILSMQLTEGRNREIRRMLARLGYNVEKLKRTAIGPLTDRGLKIGSGRVLSDAEVSKLKKSGLKPL